MEVVYWIFIGIFVFALLFGLKGWIAFFADSWHSNGVSFTVRLIILMILFITPALVKDYSPEYYGLSIWALILYSVSLIGFRFFKRSEYKSDLEDS